MHSRGSSSACRPSLGLYEGPLQAPALLWRAGWHAKSGKEGRQVQGKLKTAAVGVFCLLLQDLGLL